LHVFVKGTNFQIKVWEALLKIPMGGVTTYQSIASTIKVESHASSWFSGRFQPYRLPDPLPPRNSQDGILGEYRWSAARKKSIIGWEMAKAV